jgi:hypothetical protein
MAPTKISKIESTITGKKHTGNYQYVPTLQSTLLLLPVDASNAK